VGRGVLSALIVRGSIVELGVVVGELLNADGLVLCFLVYEVVI